jgi:YYY domain-containing protein
MSGQPHNIATKPRFQWGNLLVIAALIVTLASGAYLRLTGVNWDEDQHLHPDERFLSLVQSHITPLENGGYFDTANSTLNPSNVGHTFFVYGTLPIFIVRYLGEALGQNNYNTITILGRQVSAVFDVITILLVFLIGKQLYNKWAGLLGAVFYALAVLPIQLSHYATVDAITNTFAYLAVYAAVWALKRKPSEPEYDSESVELEKGKRILRDLAPYILFGVALGAATASKINAVTLALVIVLVEVVRYLRLPTEGREKAILPAIRNLVVAAVISFLVFRVAQPYAFNGPGFFNMGINPEWWSALQNLRAQASGDVDFPPALQWARRPVTFALENLVLWGLGAPLGVFAWLSYLGMGWAIIRKRNWQVHLPLWAFTGFYFLWQSLSWVRTMRYQILIYPALALFAGWGLVQLWSARNIVKVWFIKLKPKLIRITGIILTLIVVLTTAFWAFAFSSIYTRMQPRLAASRWIYQNIPGALTLSMETDEGTYLQPLPYRAGDILTADTPFPYPFYAVADGAISSITFPNILDQSGMDFDRQVQLTLTRADTPDQVLGGAVLTNTFTASGDSWKGVAYEFILDSEVTVIEGDLYVVTLTLLGGDTTILLNGAPEINLTTSEGMALVETMPRILQSVRADAPYAMSVSVVKTGLVTEVQVPYLVDLMGAASQKDLLLTLALQDEAGTTVTAELNGTFEPGADIRGQAYTFLLDEPLAVQQGQTLAVTLSTDSPGVRLVLHAPNPALESSWDDAIPYPTDGFYAYSDTGGIYRGDLNFEMYWTDNDLKLEMFETQLDQADYIFITSSRQWGTTTRVPERYLLTTFYYRNLLGCPEGEDIEWCYGVAEPGMFEGNLGFELVETFDSNPTLGPIEINDQASEEAFTVYDHAKVLIFKKTDDYDPIAVRELLRSVDLSQVVYFTPGDAADYQAIDPETADDPENTLMLPEDQWEEQQESGTWSELFDRESLLNTSQPLAVIAFYGLVLLLGFVCYPLVRMALPGLADRGYPLSKLAGLLVLAFVVWILGSFGVPFTRTTICLVLLGLVVLSAVLIFLQRKMMVEELRANWRYFLAVEILGLVAFVFFLLVRLGNPDLWHPYKGGEKPMDFAFLNAVLKSTTFPPYNPWFAGAYINYYYYGFVIVGVPIKLLGIVPSVAYNIILPIWYSLLILGGFSVGWNLYLGLPRSRALRAGEPRKQRFLGTAFWVGLATAIGLALLGNLGTVKLIITGFQQLAAGGAAIAEAGLGQKIAWAFQGFVQFLRGTPMPFYPGDWYWYPSRVIPGEPITEFPYFTFLYADPHAHLWAFPITVLAISWCLSVVQRRARWGEADGRLKVLGTIIGFGLGAVVIGALQPTNTWDFYTYIVLASIALFYAVMRRGEFKLLPALKIPTWIRKVGSALLVVGVFVLLTMLLYQPFTQWFGQGYTKIELWEGDRTPLSSYFTHWGLFLFIILSWMAWETYHWMKTTPESDLKKLSPYQTWIYAGVILFLITLLALLVQGVVVALVVLPVGVWVIILMFRPGRSDGHRFLLFLIGTAVFLTLVVELIYLSGDIGRMNTVFKFYLQAWIMLALSSGVCLFWTFQSLKYWKPRLELVWQALLFILVVSAALFPLLGTTDKINDRMAEGVPTTLDGMAYMQYATYYDMGMDMQLEQDYEAILWMQENIEGSPVILEGQAYEYRWGNRYSIYTGLPGVVGWNWHQRQQRAILGNNEVQERVDAVGTFYLTLDVDYVQNFIDQYEVGYIVVGQLEEAFFPGEGLTKFTTFDGILWEEVFRTGQTVIYRVLD